MDNEKITYRVEGNKVIEETETFVGDGMSEVTRRTVSTHGSSGDARHAAQESNAPRRSPGRFSGF